MHALNRSLRRITTNEGASGDGPHPTTPHKSISTIYKRLSCVRCIETAEQVLCRRIPLFGVKVVKQNPAKLPTRNFPVTITVTVTVFLFLLFDFKESGFRLQASSFRLFQGWISQYHVCSCFTRHSEAVPLGSYMCVQSLPLKARRKKCAIH
jgi:hypothetical protein